MTEDNQSFIRLGRSEEFERKLENGFYDSTITRKDRYTNPKSDDYRIFRELSELDWKPETYHLLDVGSSTGEALETLIEELEGETEAEFEAYALDANPEILQEAGREIRPVTGRSQSMPFEKDSFDIVVSANLNLKSSDIEDTVQEINRVLKPDGNSVLSQGYEENGYTGLHRGKIS